MTSISEAAAAAAPTSRTASHEFPYVKTSAIFPSKTNPRKTFDDHYIQELAGSLREVGVLEPVLVRPAGDDRYELISGECRWRAAKVAALAEMPVRILPLTDQQVLEVQVIENLQRRDLSPLEEAAGYRQLLATKKYSVERIAERIAKSVKYVYDRIKLEDLTKEAKELLRKERFSAGHAILLARLKPAEQAQALEDGLFVEERLLAFSGDEQPDEGLKPKSVREFEDWIDRHIRFEAAEADPVLFPQTVATVEAATSDNEKVVRITHNEMTPDALREGPPAILGKSWKRADGLMGSKVCDHSVIGQVVLGEDRGQAFLVCVAKKKCAVHWPEQARAAKKVKKAAEKAVARGEDPDAARKRETERQRERNQFESDRWEKAQPAIRTALVAALKKAPAGGASALGKLVVGDRLRDMWGKEKDAVKLLPPTGGADSVVRFLGLATLIQRAGYGKDDFQSAAKAFGVDVKAFVEAALPPLATCRECGCTEAVACVGGCSWLERPDKKTGKGLCSSAKCAAKRKGAQPSKATASKRQAAAARA